MLSAQTRFVFAHTSEWKLDTTGFAHPQLGQDLPLIEAGLRDAVSCTHADASLKNWASSKAADITQYFSPEFLPSLPREPVALDASQRFRRLRYLLLEWARLAPESVSDFNAMTERLGAGAYYNAIESVLLNGFILDGPLPADPEELLFNSMLAYAQWGRAGLMPAFPPEDEKSRYLRRDPVIGVDGLALPFAIGRGNGAAESSTGINHTLLYTAPTRDDEDGISTEATPLMTVGIRRHQDAYAIVKVQGQKMTRQALDAAGRPHRLLDTALNLLGTASLKTWLTRRIVGEWHGDRPAVVRVARGECLMWAFEGISHPTKDGSLSDCQDEKSRMELLEQRKTDLLKRSMEKAAQWELQKIQKAERIFATHRTVAASLGPFHPEGPWYAVRYEPQKP